MSAWEKNVRRVMPYVPGEQPREAGFIKLNTNENPYPLLPQCSGLWRGQRRQNCASTRILRRRT